jgi:two-component system sensor histidine kinase SenX3
MRVRTPRPDVDSCGSQLREATLRADEATAHAIRLQRALEALSPWVVISDEGGRVVFRTDIRIERHVQPIVRAAADELLRAAEGRSPLSRTLELYGPPPRTIHIMATVLEHEGAAVGRIAVIDDVSERRRLDAVRRDFVANVSHELRTPVGALGVLAEALADEEDPAALHRLATRITAEVERARRLIEDLLDLSRIETKGPHPEGRVQVDGAVAAALERVRSVAAQRAVHVVQTARQPAAVVVGDEGQLVSAIANLLDNAVKYSDPGSDVEVAVHTNEGDVEVLVRDRGIGIPARDLERIFERFYRVDRARSRETGGTGLGLSIVRHVATNHGGEVLVRSIEGQGSAFTLRLPAAGS